MLLFDAVFINNGGGKVLLDYLISRLEKSGIDVIYLLDDRVVNNHFSIKGKEVFYIKAGIYNRHQFYKKHAKRFRKVLCFGNIPSTFKLNCPTYTYFHNVLFIEDKMQQGFKANFY